MIIPGWFPVWLVKAFDFVTGGKSVPVIECITCGAVIECSWGMAEADIQKRAEAHGRYLHPEWFEDPGAPGITRP